MMASAPAARASMVAAAPFSASDEQTTVGVGRSAMIFFRKVSAIHARHFDVDHQDIRPLDLHAFEREQRVGGGADHLDVGFALEGLLVHLTDDRGVVDEHDLDLLHG